MRITIGTWTWFWGFLGDTRLKALTYTKTEAQQSRELTVIPKVATKNENPFVSSFKAFKRSWWKVTKLSDVFLSRKLLLKNPSCALKTFHTYQGIKFWYLYAGNTIILQRYQKCKICVYHWDVSNWLWCWKHTRNLEQTLLNPLIPVPLIILPSSKMRA